MSVTRSYTYTMAKDKNGLKGEENVLKGDIKLGEESGISNHESCEKTQYVQNGKNRRG